MDSKELISAILSEFAIEFTEYTYNYWLDDSKENHFIEVIPSTYKISDKFIDREVALLELFYKNFFDESLSFISSSDLEYIGKLSLVKSIPSSSQWENYTVRIAESSIHRGEKFRQNITDLTYNLAEAA